MKQLALFGIGAFFGTGLGFLIAAQSGAQLDGHDHDHSASLATDAAFDVHLTKDPMSGWNLHIQTDNFRFAPQNASTPHVDGEGHAHVYVNDVKIARVYSPWVHIDAQEGDTVTVTLTSNDHAQLTRDAKVLSVTKVVKAP